MNTNEANLGYASNAELCAELDARQSMGHTAPDYRTVDAAEVAVSAGTRAVVERAAERNNVARSQQGHSCDYCNGTGKIRRNLMGGDYEDEPCPECHGSGFFTFLTIDGLQAAVDERAQFIDPNGRLDLAFFAIELGGEAGEALNKVKKLIREKMGIPGSRATTEELADELADVIITACNVARLARIDLNQSIRRKFNETSRVRGLPVKI